MCDLPARRSEYEFTTDDFRQMLGQLKELGVAGIAFTGGEVTLRKDIDTILELSRQANFDTILVTNALELERHIDRIVEIEVNTVNVSLDSADPSVHDRIRGVEGAFERTTGNVKRLLRRIQEQRARTELVVSTVLGPLNFKREQLNALIEYVDGLGAGRIVFCPVHDFNYSHRTVGVGGMDPGYDLSDYLLHHPKRSLIDNSDWYLGCLTDVLKNGNPPAGCVAGYTTIFIDWELNVYPCKAYLEIGQPLYRLRNSEITLSQAWYSETFDKFRRSCRSCRQCFLSVNREFDAVF